MRDRPHVREELFTAFRDELARMGATVTTIDGLGAQREREAIAAIRDRLAMP